jgi:hypothetical protein
MSTSNYIPVEIDAVPTDVAANAFTYIEQQVPGWLPSPGNLEAWLIEALAQIASELLTLVSQVPDSVFGYFGETIVGLPPYPAVAATGMTKWTAVDAAGYVVNAGTVVAITPPSSSSSYTFQVAQSFAIAAGQTVVDNVQVTALAPGAASSGITGTVQVIDALDFVQSVTLDAATSGGSDGEADDAYRSRLSALLTLLARRPILPQDFATLLVSDIAGVARATAIDLYNPGPPIVTNEERCVTVAICDASGNPCSAAIKTQADDLLQSEREVNFLVFVVDPTYTTIDVTADVVCNPGYDPAQVQSAASNALANYLSSASWGVPTYGDPSVHSWLNTTVVRYNDVIGVLDRVAGLSYVSSLTLGVGGGAQAAADVALGGVAPLTQPGAIAVTAT